MSRMKVVWLVALALAVATPGLAQDVEKKIHKVRVEKIVHCEDGEECVDREEQPAWGVFVGDDGEVRVLAGDAEENEWVSGDDHQVLIFRADEAEGDAGVDRLHRVMKRMKSLSALHRHGDGPEGGAFLGVQLSDLTPELRTHFGVPDDAGVIVGQVVDDSPAFRAGVEVGDIVTAVDGEPVASSQALRREIRGRQDGDTVVLEVWRDGRVEKIDAALEEREDEPRFRISRAEAGDSQGVEERVIRIERGASALSDSRVISVEVDCDGEGDCAVDVDGEDAFVFEAVDCGDAAECDVTVECDGGDCACTVNGASTDCSGLPGFPR